MVSRKFTVLLEPTEECGFIVKCLELPVATQGETKEEALKNIKEAIEGYLEVKTRLLGRKVKGEKTEVVVEAPSALLA
jgi:predicted RNase H-like HicB family nuclease